MIGTCSRHDVCRNNTKCHHCFNGHLFRDKSIKKVERVRAARMKHKEGWKSLEVYLASLMSSSTNGNDIKNITVRSLESLTPVVRRGKSYISLKEDDLNTTPAYAFSFADDSHVYLIFPANVLFSLLGGEEARRVGGSGNKWYQPGDVRSESFLIEGKDRTKNPFPLHREWLEKIREQAALSGRIGVLGFRYTGTGSVFGIIEREDLLELMVRRQGQ
jgi:hypothetical protein